MDYEEALIRGCSKAAIEIYKSLIRSGVIDTSKPEIMNELASIIAKCLIAEIKAEKQKGGE